VHSQTKLKQSIGGIEKPDGTLTSDESEMAEILNNFFSSIFINEHLLNVPSMKLKYSGKPLSCIYISLVCAGISFINSFHPNLAVLTITMLVCLKKLKKVYFNLFF